ncbi:uroporphyrinogen-III C-methyltransferase [Konateibacter massiliensis]|uniref:uroporphyrinogen-III C-methyltransferase n=1 Tax=Konateibacter massiliensis TaxID=2002841 RepID=UPI000C148199|nr:uroporphyrinogen-III C-methyltransferase [Konateibacter massiliensis]
MRKIRVGSRESKLAVVQSQLIIDGIKKHHPELEIELITMKTTGDKILDRTLDKVGGKGLFVKELDKALLNNEIDLAVHSLKDMPMETDERLPILAYSKREDARDVLILPKGVSELNKELPIGCSSLRRTLQLRALFPDMEVKPVRGNVLTRLEKLDSGEFSALILAAAGMKRLKLEKRISREFTVEEMLPAAGQGILAMQGRAGEDYSFLECVNNRESELAATSERAFIKALNGGCTSPVAAYATVQGETITLNCMFEDGKKGQWKDNAEHAKELGEYAAGKKEKKIGKVWLVGAGPSDPELLTLKAKRILEQADTIVYDRLVGDGILSMLSDTAQKFYVGKQAGNHAVSQDKINELLLEEAQKGKKVVRLKGGDPFVFGRGGEELELLVENKVPFEIIPGITSAVSVPAYQGIPVTYRDYCSSLHIITGHKKQDEPLDIDFEALVRTKGTLVFLMSVSSLEEICEGLIAGGMEADIPAAVLENGTKAHQRKVVSTLSHLHEEAEKAKIQSPSIIVVGKVCALSEKFAWYDKNTLSGQKIVITRPRELTSKLSLMLRERGAEVLELPSIKTVQIPNNEELYSCITKLTDIHWIALTSPTGAKIFFEELQACKVDIRSLNHIKFAVIGRATGKILEEKGIFPELMPEIYTGEELGKLLAATIREKEVLLIPRAKAGAKEIIEELSDTGAVIYDVPTYETVYETPLVDVEEGFLKGEIDCAVFTSASTVEGFINANPNIDYAKIKAFCIGHKTEEAAKRYQMQTFVSKEATMESLVECLEKVVNNKTEAKIC